MLNIAKMCITEVEGPGRRLAIWFQGCLKRCVGCCNLNMLDIKPASLISEKELIEYINNIKNEIEGLTLLGGEPFLQAKNIIQVLENIDKNLTILAFSGYTKKELENLKIDKARELLKYIDVLVDGEYNENLVEDKRRWIGSKNQNIYFFTNRYSKDIFSNKIDEIEIHLKDNKIFLNGFPMDV